MSIPIKKHFDRYFCTCPKGLEEVLENELISLGAKDTFKSSRGVQFSIPKEDLLNLILYTRISSRIFMLLFDCDIKKEKDIYMASKNINWTRYFSVKQTFKFTFHQGVSKKLKKKSKFTNTIYLSQLAKDGLVDRYMKEVQKRPNIELRNPHVSLNCYLEPHDLAHTTKERMTIMVDLTGYPLADRGYRQRNQSAPVRENLAAGIIDLADWNPETENFIDLTCGSGTFLFEAKIKKLGLSPQLINLKYIINKEESWNFQYFRFLDTITRNNKFQSTLKKAFNESNEKLNDPLGLEFIANDFSRKTLDSTKTWMKKIGWDHGIEFTTKNASKFDLLQNEKNLLFTNPPFGKRVDAIDEKVSTLYYEMGENFKRNYPNSRFVIMSSEREYLKKISLRPNKKNKFSHGSIDCDLFTYLQK